MSEDNEQWKGEGICAKCRRLPYCTKECTAQQRRRKKMERQLMRRKNGDSLLEREMRRVTGNEAS